MKYLAILALLLLSTSAYAEDAPKPKDISGNLGAESVVQPFVIPAGAYVFVLENADLNTLAAAIQELPMKTAQPLLAKLQGQAQEQAKIKDAIKSLK